MSAPPPPDAAHFAPESAPARADLRLKVDTAAERLAARRKLAESIGTDDQSLLDRIEQLGFTGDTVKALDVLPLVHVAWADGKVQAKERAAVLSVLDRRGVAPGSQASLFVEALLEKRPSESYLAESLFLLKDLASRSGTDVSDLVDLCARVAEASGGLFGLRESTNDAEQKLIGKIAEALGEGAVERFKTRFRE